jgi:hypothetical protein
MPARTRHGDIGEAPVFTLGGVTDARAERLEGLRQLDRRLVARIVDHDRGCGPLEHRTRGRVSSERIREMTEGETRSELSRTRGELSGDEAHDRHGVPFEPLRAVNGEKLDDTRLGRLGARREVVGALCLIDPGEQAAEGAALVDREEAANLLRERAKLQLR